ncbi:MAG: succinate--CoA ligase subunit alpha [Chloroflexi bacterium]|nr:succinate--CoA ligase subunit alpha [Chloroflexota bacterium]
MSILVDASTRVLVQGITGREGSFHTRQMLDYGTNIVGGVTPRRGGETVNGLPVFDTVQEATQETGANAAVVLVPAPFAADAVLEAADAGLSLVVCITEGIPLWDTLRVLRYLQGGPTRVLGPNCPGITVPGMAKIGIIPGHIHMPGSVGVVSRSGTLTYEVVWALTQRGLGQSTCLGIGGDPVVGTTFVDALRLFEADDQTEAVVLIGEIGGSAEEEAAQYIAQGMTKPVVALVAGRTAPPGRRMGHAGAIVSGGTGDAASKIAAFQAAGVPVADHPEQVGDLLREVCG